MIPPEVCDVGAFKFIARHTPIKHDEWWFELDEYVRPTDGQQFLQAHVRFRKFNKSLLKQAIKEWNEFRQFVTAPIFAFSEDGSNKFERFVAHLGFKPLDVEVPLTNGETRRLFLHLKGIWK